MLDWTSIQSTPNLKHMLMLDMELQKRHSHGKIKIG